MSRVARPETIPARDRGGVEEQPLVPPLPGSPLALARLLLPAGAAAGVGDAEADTLLFCVAGRGRLDGETTSAELAPCSSALLPAGAAATLTAGDEAVETLVATVGPECDLHAPMGAASPVESLDAVEPGKATGARSFQVLYDASNGSSRATLFVGHIPPGRAPWHYHLYDEIVWVLSGEGRLHLGDAPEPLAPGCAFRLAPREVHVVENTAPDRPLSVLGLFTPAGSPSAAYLTPGVFAEVAAR